jgi:hypothetical protein
MMGQVLTETEYHEQGGRRQGLHTRLNEFTGYRAQARRLAGQEGAKHSAPPLSLAKVRELE